MTGVGGALGSRVAALLEAEPGVEAIAGLDVAEPVRPLQRTQVTVVDPRDRRLVVAAVRRFVPTAVVHLGIYEPEARSTPRVAAERTAMGTTAVLGAAVDAGALDRIVIRSGIELYGRRRGAPVMPDEGIAPDPTSPFGESLLRAEELAFATGQETSVPVAALRFAPLVGPDFPSPLGRLLGARAVPVSALADPPFCLLHADDASWSVLEALRRRVDGPLNIVGPGAVTTFQVVRMGRRLPIPVLGPQWMLARRLASLLGSPVPEHLLELLQRGRTADGGRAATVLGRAPRYSTREVARAIYRWAPVAPLRPVRGEAA